MSEQQHVSDTPSGFSSSQILRQSPRKPENIHSDKKIVSKFKEIKERNKYTENTPNMILFRKKQVIFKPVKQNAF